MKALSMILMGGALLTLLSFQIPANETQTEDYLPIDTTMSGIELDESTALDFDSENL